MDAKRALELECRKSWKRLRRVSETYGPDSHQANMFRAKWYGYDEAYQIVYKETILYD